MRPVTIKPANREGENYVITDNGHQLVLSRNSKKGRYNGIGMTRADVIAVCNALIDLVEAMPS